jgi:hypothetical protein
MKRALLIILAQYFTVSGISQTPRVSLYEFFTGENNPPAANINPGLYSLLANSTNSALVAAINWEVPIPSAPSPTWSLYKTNQVEIDWRYKSVAAGGYGYQTQNTSTSLVSNGINQSPYGLLDGQFPWLFGAASCHPVQLNNTVIATAQSYTSAFSVTMSRAWDPTSSAVNLTVSIAASAGFTATGSLVFRTVMVERYINFTSPPGTNGETSFQHVAVRSYPTLQGGVAMAPTWTLGQTQTFTLNCVLPSYIRDKAQVAFVGFIQDDGDRRVAQTVQTGTAGLSVDAKALSMVMPPLPCTNSQASPTVVVANNGTTTITNLTLTSYVNATSAASFTWSGSIAPSATVAINLTPFSSSSFFVGSNSYSVIISGVNGGDNNLLNNSLSATINVQSTAPNVFFSPSSASVCAGNTIALTPFGASTYTLYPGGSTGVGFTVVPLVSMVYSVIGVSSAGCVSGNVATAMITTVPGPSVTLSPSSSTLCAGNSLTFSASGASNYIMLPGSQNGPVFTVGPSASTTYTVIGGTASCYGTATHTATVHPKPTILINNVGGPLSTILVCEGEELALTASGANTFTWNNTIVSQSIVISPSMAAIYTVTGSNAATGCTSEAKVEVALNPCTGLQIQEEAEILSMYPNPASETIYIFLNQKLPYVDLTFTDLAGRVVFTKRLAANENKLDLAQLPAGIYQVKASSGGKRFILIRTTAD